jgi:beta-glucuronidase
VSLLKSAIANLQSAISKNRCRATGRAYHRVSERCASASHTEGQEDETAMLLPRDSETREVRDLGGIWSFRTDEQGRGVEAGWPAEGLEPPTREMPVPSSYNDVTQEAAIRDLVGTAWYERSFFVPAGWEGRRIVLRFGSATHHATVWVNGTEAARHRGGFLPFEADVTAVVRCGEPNRVTVAVNNELDWTTLPTGELRTYDDAMHPEGFRKQEIHFDFFNYAGLHRPVKLLATPKTYVDDVTVLTDIEGEDGVVRYDVRVAGGDAAVRVRLLDADGYEVAAADGADDQLRVADAELWRPGRAYLYTLEIQALVDGGVADIYRLPVGIRTVEVDGSRFLINGEPFYFRGFGKHEDADVRGRGYDDVITCKDFNLLEWIGANSFRTSHYPYAEEILEMADRRGVAVIAEAPAVGMNFFDPNRPVFSDERVGPATLEHHLAVLREMIARDKNHPSVVVWLVANEPAAGEDAATDYFEPVAAEVRRLDPTRPVTVVNVPDFERCRIGHLFDVICVNSYYSWYFDPGHLELIETQLLRELRGWHEKYHKPVVVTEYGADAVAGLHEDPPRMFTEEYQCEFLRRYHAVFDRLDFVVGEHVWNFADFMTKQGVKRVVGNRKGVFTRQRQPKAAAHLLRERWTSATGGA